MRTYNELELIEKYFSSVGHRVLDLKYFREHFIITGAAGYDIGATQGFPANHQFFFGNISIDAELSGVIVLANENLLSTVFSTNIYGNVPAEIQDIRVRMGVNLGMSLMGNGFYIGGKRLYGVGCNRVSVQFVDIGAAVVEYWVGFNGFMFTVL